MRKPKGGTRVWKWCGEHRHWGGHLTDEHHGGGDRREPRSDTTAAAAEKRARLLPRGVEGDMHSIGRAGDAIATGATGTAQANGGFRSLPARAASWSRPDHKPRVSETSCLLALSDRRSRPANKDCLSGSGATIATVMT